MTEPAWKRALISGFPWRDMAELDRMDRELACEACGLLIEVKPGKHQLSPAGELEIGHEQTENCRQP